MGLKLRTRIGLIFATGLVTLVLVLGMTFWGYRTARYADVTISQNLVPSVDASRRLMDEADHLFTDTLMYPLDVPNRAHIEQSFTYHRARFDTNYVQAVRHADLPEERELVKAVHANYHAFLRTTTHMRDMVENKQPQEARRVHREEVGPAFEKLQASALALFDYNRQQIDRLNKQALNRFNQASAISMAIAALGILVMALLWRVSTQDILKPLRSVLDGGSALAEGRFVRVDDPRAAHTYELGVLQDSFNRMSDRLKVATESLQDANSSLEAQVAERTVELRTANVQLQGMVEELKTLDKLKSDFLAIVSHELLTPLNFIVGFGSALEDELMGPLNPQQRETMGKLLAGAERLTRMVRNTLEYTRLESGNAEILPDVVALREVVESLNEKFEPVLQARGQSLSLELPEQIPVVWADPERVWQVLFELLDNAAKFSDDGSTIHLAVRPEHDLVSIEVSDSGTGIPEDAIADLGRPFFQADFSQTRAHGGLGLGLAIAHHLVARMNGTMVVESTTGKGTLVRVVLPQAAGRTAPSPEKVEEA